MRADGGGDGVGFVLSQSLDQAHPQAHGALFLRAGCMKPVVVAGFERAIPLAVVHIDRSNGDIVLFGITDDLRGGVKPHRLAVDQRGGKHGGVMTFQPRRDIHE